MTTPNAITERYPLAILGHSQLTPAACGALAVAIEDSIGRVEAWGLNVRSQVRLRRAIAQLKRAAARDSYGATPDERRRTAQAIYLANDIYVITRALPRERDPSLIEEFRRILAGTLETDTGDRRAYQTQSQFWFGALLAHSNLHPALLTYEGTRPDYLVTVLDQVRMTVEVKRPGSIGAAENLIEEGAHQIDAARLPGFLVLDASDLVAAELAAPGGANNDGDLALNDGTTYFSTVRPVLYTLADQLFEYVERYVAVRPGDATCRVIGLIMYSRHSVLSDTDPATHDFGFLIRGQQLSTTTARLYRDAADRMFQLLEHGIEKITGHPLRRL